MRDNFEVPNADDNVRGYKGEKAYRMLEDDGKQDCDAGHILANRLGGYGNTPINIFPQDATINRGEYAQFEGDIYNCLYENTEYAYLEWVFYYESNNRTMPNKVKYSAEFTNSDCDDLYSIFSKGRKSNIVLNATKDFYSITTSTATISKGLEYNCYLELYLEELPDQQNMTQSLQNINLSSPKSKLRPIKRPPLRKKLLKSYEESNL